MKIWIDEERTNDLHAKLITTMDAEKREGIHASDLLGLRRAYWSRVNPLPTTPEELGYFVLGRGHHYVMVYALSGVPDSQEESKFSKELGINYSPDLLALHGEVKTSRLLMAPKDKEQALKWFDGYIPQVMTYAIAEGVSKWWLYMCFFNPTDLKTQKKLPPFFLVYGFEFTKQELRAHKEWVISRRLILEGAIAKRDHSQLDNCPEFYCVKMEGQGRGKPKRMVAKCKYFELCKPKERYDLVHNPPTKFVRKVQENASSGTSSSNS